jgi:hypothetical protein
LNARFTHYKADVVFGQLGELELFTTHAQKTGEGIRANGNLTTDGKRAEFAKTSEATGAEVSKWLTKRLSGLDADIANQRATLAPVVVKLEPTRFDALRRLETFTPQERMTLYSSAQDAVRAEMEAVSAALGSIPTRTDRGLEWLPLLDSSAVNEAVLSRAEAKNPQGAARLRELEEIRSMTQTVANVALADIKEALTL